MRPFAHSSGAGIEIQALLETNHRPNAVSIILNSGAVIAPFGVKLSSTMQSASLAGNTHEKTTSVPGRNVAATA